MNGPVGNPTGLRQSRVRCKRTDIKKLDAVLATMLPTGNRFYIGLPKETKVRVSPSVIDSGNSQRNTRFMRVLSTT